MDRPVRVLGPLEVFDGDEYRWIRAAKWRGLLAALVIHCGRVVSLDQISAELWGDSPPRGAVTTIHGYVMRLRRMLGDRGARLLVTRSPGYLLTVPPTEIDAGKFGQLATNGLAALRAGEVTEASARLTEALALWRGPALADVPTTPLVQAEVARLDELRLTVLEARVDADLALGKHADLVAELRTLVRDHPLRERLWSQLMLALHRCGRNADALAAYHEVRGILRDELGIPPSPALNQLHQHILDADGTLGLPTHEISSQRPLQLPAASTTFVGRTAELSRLLALSANVITISGMPGVGKTTLAVYAAHRLASQFTDGQVFLDLHGFTRDVSPVRPMDALERLLRAIGVADHHIPADVDDRAALLRSRLAGQRMLIVLDNALDEAQIRPLLPGTPGCQVLITSRRRFTGVDDTCPLSLDVFSQAEAVDLITQVTGPQAASAVDEIASLCGRLPLAVRIAAARLRSRPAWTAEYFAERLRAPGQRLAELDDGERRLSASFHLSYRRLTPDQQRAFRQFADVADESDRLLEALVDNHLLEQPAPGRYELHDLLRCYARHLEIHKAQQPPCTSEPIQNWNPASGPK
ncbi:AfsR/SARP family transcriptional regulator [Kibdelosporangium aridum]|uniref:AfsR/SARP family transcriptional regulator n=1 Tax=Kibdelosporangium aridum TaxID=2030 RepID=UPI000689DFF8